MNPSKTLLTNFLKTEKETFASQYTFEEFDKIKNETLNSQSTMKLYISLENKFFPNADEIMKAAMEVNYINEKTIFLGKPTPSEIEKKLDYLNISAIQILENWLLNILPRQDKNPTNIMSQIDNVEAGWMWAFGKMKLINEMYNTLEKEFNTL